MLVTQWVLNKYLMKDRRKRSSLVGGMTPREGSKCSDGALGEKRVTHGMSGLRICSDWLWSWTA